MNLSFPRDAHHPLRWIVLDEPGHGAHFIVVTYHHAAADAASVERLFGAILHRYCERKTPNNIKTCAAETAPIRPGMRRAPVDHHLAHPILKNGPIRTWWSALRLIHRVHYSHRLKEKKPGADDVRVLVRSTPAGFLEQLRAACRTRGVGLNDVLVAAMACAIADQTRREKTRNSRRKLALGTILNLRRGGDAWRGQGPWTGGGSPALDAVLGEMIVVIDDPDAPVEEVAAQVRAQRKRCSPEKHAAIGAACSLVAWNVWPLLRIGNRRDSYRKFFPICAGVSSVIIDPAHFGAAAAHISRYVRAISTGPATPLALAPTGYTDGFELSLTHRDVRRGCGEPEELLELVVEKLMVLAQTTQPPSAANVLDMPRAMADAVV